MTKAKSAKKERIGQIVLKQWSGSDFPLHCNYQVIPKGHKYSPHTHDGVELVFITKGSGIEYIGGVTYPIITGDLFVIDVGSTHAFTVESNLEFYNLIFQPELFSKDEMSELASIPHFHSFFLPKKRATQAKLGILPAVQERINTLFSRLTRELAARRP
ncbi:MAG: AraC family ligand binding domain-containing protein, partial [Spirochaetia bacterium]|nr:AraC family ligand binding domain-containing protein [Spirochaetia bacterium]